MKRVDVKSNTCIDYDKEINDKNLNFKIGGNVRISKYENTFTKGYTSNRSEEVFVIKKVKNTVPWKYVTNDYNGEETVGTFYDNKLQKQNQKEFEQLELNN